MTSADDAIQPLLEALRVSPENLRLRLHIASLMRSFGRATEALHLVLEGQQHAPRSDELKLEIARCYHAVGKHSTAIVIVEELLGGPSPQAPILHLHARLLMREGRVDEASRQYRRALELEPGLEDSELRDMLGPGVVHDDEDDDDDEDQRLRLTHHEVEDAPLTEIERPRSSFEHVGGMEAIKEQIRMKIIHPLEHPEIYKAYGKPIGGGLLMYGPPGCGKTHLARATAGEVKAAFISVGIHDVLDMYIGQSEQRLHQIFQQARAHTPCVLFFDEVDALGANRTDMRASGGRQLINQFLAELDGVDQSNEGVLILAATNAPWHLDNAFRRPGRFDRVLFVPPPDPTARAAILRVLLTGKPVADINHEKIARKTDRFSGADLKALVDSAIEGKLEEAMRTGRPDPITTGDLLRAASQVKPTTSEWFSTARNYALYANEGGLYDDILKHMKIT